MLAARRLVVLVVVALCGSPVAGQAVLETLYLEGSILPGADSLPGFAADETVRSNGQGSLRAAPNGAFVTRVRTDPFEGSANSAAGVYYLFGSTDDELAPTAFRREAMLAGIDQQSVDSPNVDLAGNVVYTALTGNNGLAGSGETGVWENDTPIWYAEEMIPSGPLAGSYYGSPGGLYLSPQGEASWVTSYSATSDGEAAGSALMQGLTTNDVLLASGYAIAGLGTIAAESGAINGNIKWSIGGSNYITEVDVELGFTDTDEAPIVNGQALHTASGVMLREGATIPTVDGGLADEVWESFSLFDVNEAGDWVIGAFTSDDEADDVLIYNGQILYRNGDTVDGVVLEGQVQGVAVNDLGDLAMAWNDTLFINGQKIAGPGDLKVDSDGDGVADDDIDGTGLSLNNIEITNLPAAGGEGLPVVYLAGEAAGGKDTMFRLIPADRAAGDFNGDGVVDGADYTVWRDTLGSSLLLGADANNNAVVDVADYEIWRTNFGAGASPAGAIATPEPATAWLTFALAMGLLGPARFASQARRRG